MASPPPGPSPSDGSKPAAPSLAAWKSGATKMTTSAAGDHVSKTAPKPQPKAAKVSKPAPSTRPWAEQSIAERYGTQPRKVNPNKQLKDALRYLEAQQDRGCITWEEIITQGIPPWYDTVEGGDLYNALTGNPRVVATSRGFAYQSEHGISDKSKLLRHIRAHPEGVKSSEIKDGYETVLEDADKLQKEGLVYKIYNAEFKVDVFFPVPQQHFHTISEDLVDVYLRTQVPTETHDLIAAVLKANMHSALSNTEKVQAANKKRLGLLKPEKKKKKRKLNLKHITNTHMAHVLADNQYTSID